MADRMPRVVGLKELLALEKPLRESPAPIIYFTEREFKRLIKGAEELERRPRGSPLVTFDPWPGGGVVQGRCESPVGQVCVGRWIPAGPDRGGGIYFGCTCRGTSTVPPPPPSPCQ